MPNPLTDELSDDAKAELAAQFADLKQRFFPIDPVQVRRANRSRTSKRPWEMRTK
jgi:hypothetical protein